MKWNERKPKKRKEMKTIKYSLYKISNYEILNDFKRKSYKISFRKNAFTNNWLHYEIFWIVL